MVKEVHFKKGNYIKQSVLQEQETTNPYKMTYINGIEPIMAMSHLTTWTDWIISTFSHIYP